MSQPAATRPLRLAVLCPHFAPDTAPTGAVITRIVTELASLGHRIDVVTALPWYRDHAIEPAWRGAWVRREPTTWGSITRVHPFPGDDRSNLPRRALGFVGFSALALVQGVRGGRVDAVIAMSPPLTNGVIGWLMKRARRAPLVFNIQDIFPDAAVQSGAITNRVVIAVGRALERATYAGADAVTVLSSDLGDNVAAKVGPAQATKVRVIPNFVLTAEIRPLDRQTEYRRELGIGAETVVMYAGNVGFSQSLGLVAHAAREMRDVMFVVNGDGAARDAFEASVAGLDNVRVVGYQPFERLPEVLATADVHLVPLRAGLGRVSVPSKTYSILAAGRAVLAAIDPDTEIPRILRQSGAGVTVVPDDPEAFVTALRRMLADPAALADMGRRGREWVLHAASPRAVAVAYEQLIRELEGDPAGRVGGDAATAG